MTISNYRNFIIQFVVIICAVALFAYFYLNVTRNLAHDNIASGFAFLNQEAGFSIDMNLISFSPTSTNLRAFFVAILNTLLVSALAIIFSTILGNLIAYARLSRNWLLKNLAHGYVSLFRNLPILLLVLFFYFALLQYLPQTDASCEFMGIVANVRGISVFGLNMIPEFVAMFLALTLYSTSYIAEHIRHGLQTIDKGQYEAALVCGFSPWQRFKLIIYPQALRAILPPVVTQHLMTLKDSSLGVAIGYPELVMIFEGSVLNYTGQAIEPIFMTMSFYLLISMLITYLVDVFNRRMVIPGK